MIVYSRPTARKNHPYLINRKTGTVSVLSIGENEIIAQPLDGLLQGDGFPDLSGSGASMLVVDGMSDGETVLIHTLNAISSLVMYHVPTGEIQTLTADGYTGIAAPQMFSGNHYDSFWMFNWNDFTEYTQLVIK